MTPTANPARRLLDLFEDWETKNGAAHAQRRITTDAGWAETAEAFECLRDIAMSLDFMENQGHDVSVFRENLPKWRGSVLHYGQSWSQTKTFLDGEDNLRGLSFAMGIGNYRALKERLPADFRGLLDEIVEGIRDDESLDPFLQHHVLKLVSHIRALLEDDRAGLGFDLAEALARLRIYMDAAAEQTTSPSKRERFREWSTNLATDVIAGAVTTTVTLGLGQILP